MSYLNEIYQKRKWYLSHEILYVEPDSASTNDKLLVWENLILIKADSPEEAYEKAIRNGLNSEEEVRIDGVVGRMKFKGLKDLVLIYDDLEDGAELEWHQRELTNEEVEGLVKRREDLHAFNPVDFDKGL